MLAISSRFVASILSVFAAGLMVAPPAGAQTEAALRSFFEGKHVTLKIDMPGTSDGADVRPAADPPLDLQRYRDRLKNYGTAIHRGESALVTLVKLKKDVIEVHLNGGGFGTFGDDTSTSVSLRTIDKSNREKDLEKQVREEKDPKRRERLKDELDDVRNRRERENRRIDAERARLEEIKKDRIAEQRLKGGSRFNLRYQGDGALAVRPDDVMAALKEYVDFSSGSDRREPAPAASDVLPRKGLLRADAERAWGAPAESATRREGSLTVMRLVFLRGDERITAEFVEDVLVRYTLASR